MPVPAPVARPRLRDVLAPERGTSVGVELLSAGPAAVEIAGSLAFDVLVLDARHGAASPFSGETEALMRAAGAHGASVLVRAPELAPGTLNRLLNDGAHGVIVPEIRSVADAERAASACRYPPRGRRGAAPMVRSANFGLTPWDEYRESVTEDTVVLASIDSAEALAAAAGIAAVTGIDGVVFESFPLAVALGVAGAGAAVIGPDLVAAAAAVAAVRATGRIAGAAARTPAEAGLWKAAGCTFLVAGDELSAFTRLAVALRESLLFLPGAGGERSGRSLRERLDAGETVLGTFSTLVEPVYIEILGRIGFDFVITDCEESPGDSYGMKLEDLVRAADAVDMATTVRPVENRAGAINRAFNAGAQGVYVPHVRSADDCTYAVDASLYPPLGRRGAAPCVRAAGFGVEPWAGYHARVNATNLPLMMIEDVEGVESIDEIVKVPGLAGILVGTWDLAVEMGCADYGPPKPQVMVHVERVIRATVAAGLIMSAHCWSADAAQKYHDLGARMLICSLDSTLLMQALRELEAAAAVLRS